MLIKLGAYLLTLKKIDKLKKISEILFYLGIILVFAFPLISEQTFIEEKQLKNTPILRRTIDKNTFTKNYREYLSAMNNTNVTTNSILSFCLNILIGKEKKSYNYIYTKEILSPRGEKLKFIQINLIYDPHLENKQPVLSAHIVFYTLMKFYSDPNNVPWLSKDIQFNYVTKELFYEHPKECYELLISAKHNKKVSFGQKISGILNIDLTEFDIDNFEKFSFRFHGINSEQIDMDYYKMIYDNFISTFANAHRFTTHDCILSKRATSIITNFLKIPAFLFEKFLDSELYTKYILYAINYILSNFFLINNNINTNHLLVTRNKNSILMKIIRNNNTFSYMNYLISHNTTNIFNISNKNINRTEFSTYHDILIRYRYVVGAFELIIKGISRAEIDIFRGQYFYILVDPKKFVGYYYLFILVFLMMRTFFEFIIYINTHNANNFQYFQSNKSTSGKRIKGGTIIGGLLILFTISLILILNIEYVIKYLKMEFVNAYYFCIFLIQSMQMICLILFNLNEEEEKFINELLTLIMVLNCWNFISINIGAGLLISIIILPLEYLFVHLPKSNIFKIMILFTIIFSTLTKRQLISPMLYNYVNFKNNIYIIISGSIFFISLRMELFIIAIINNIIRKKRKYKKEDIKDINEKKIITDESKFKLLKGYKSKVD